jgi:hypothetical protein
VYSEVFAADPSWSSRMMIEVTVESLELTAFPWAKGCERRCES